MPIYAYRCPGCGAEKEIIALRPLGYEVLCPSCRERFMERTITSAALRFRGTGWTPKSSGGRRV